MTDKLRQIICPVCGRAIGRYHQHKIKIPGKKYYIYRDEAVDYLTDYLKRIYEMDRSYFAIEAEGGRCGFQNQIQLTPEDWPEGFEAAKEALIRAVNHYLQKGWLSIKEL